MLKQLLYHIQVPLIRREVQRRPLIETAVVYIRGQVMENFLVEEFLNL